MSLADKISGWLKSSPTEKNSFWNTIDTHEQIDEIITHSEDKIQVIFKHSRSCGTSFFVKKGIESPVFWEEWEVDLYMIEVISQRPLSQYLADKVDVRHQSPQLLILHKGKVLWHASHGNINQQSIKAVFEKLAN